MKFKLNTPYRTKDLNPQIAIINAYLPNEFDGQVYSGFTIDFDYAPSEGIQTTVCLKSWYDNGQSTSDKWSDISEIFDESKENVTVVETFKNHPLYKQHVRESK